MADFNDQIGKRKAGENQIFGPYNYRKRNKIGERFILFCQVKNLKIGTKWFKKKECEMDLDNVKHGT